MLALLAVVFEGNEGKQRKLWLNLIAGVASLQQLVTGTQAVLKYPPVAPAKII